MPLHALCAVVRPAFPVTALAVDRTGRGVMGLATRLFLLWDGSIVPVQEGINRR